jgi:hypothetical protein
MASAPLERRPNFPYNLTPGEHRRRKGAHRLAGVNARRLPTRGIEDSKWIREARLLPPARRRSSLHSLSLRISSAGFGFVRRSGGWGNGLRGILTATFPLIGSSSVHERAPAVGSRGVQSAKLSSKRLFIALRKRNSYSPWRSKSSSWPRVRPHPIPSIGTAAGGPVGSFEGADYSASCDRSIRRWRGSMNPEPKIFETGNLRLGI